MTTWYVKIGSKEHGPLSPTELLEWVRHQKIQPDTLIKKKDRRWLCASEVQGLFDAAARPTVVFRCPYCDREIPKPPCRCAHCRRDVEKAVGQLKQNPLAAKPNHETPPDLD